MDIVDLLAKHRRDIAPFSDSFGGIECSAIDYLLTHGQRFFNASRAEDEYCGEWDCHLLSRRYVLNHPECSYVEGYALAKNVLIIHAWAATPDGRVVEFYFKRPESVQYFGMSYQLKGSKSEPARGSFLTLAALRKRPVISGHLPRHLTLYRGENTARRSGMGWTTDIEEARFRAGVRVVRDGHPKAFVYRTVVTPSALLFYVKGNPEVFVDPARLTNIKRRETITPENAEWAMEVQAGLFSHKTPGFEQVFVIVAGL